MLPVVEAADVLVEEEGQLAPAAELAVLGQQFFNEPTHPAVGVVRSGIGNEEVKVIRIARHDGDIFLSEGVFAPERTIPKVAG